MQHGIAPPLNRPRLPRTGEQRVLHSGFCAGYPSTRRLPPHLRSTQPERSLPVGRDQSADAFREKFALVVEDSYVAVHRTGIARTRTSL